MDNLLNAFCKNPKKKPKLVHRIDRETSGIVLVAKNKTNAAFFSEQSAQKHANKTYYAIVSGTPTPPNGTIARSYTHLYVYKRQALNMLKMPQ